MPPPYCYDHPRPAVTVDLAVFCPSEGGIRVLLVRRKHDPFAGRWALPGGFVDIDEPIEAAARRELKEETGVDVEGPVEFLAVFGDPDRDPRGRAISIAHVAALPGPPPEPAGADDAEEAAWHDPSQVRGLAFDHDQILAQAVDWLARKIEAGPSAGQPLPAGFSSK
jgi:8-oxo-dGTP diphosphatase